MKLTSRLILLAVILLGGALTAAFIITLSEQSEHATLIESAEAALQQNTLHGMELVGSDMRKFAEDYSWWDEMVEFVNDRDPTWAEVNFEDSLEFWDVSGLWVFDPAAKLVYGLTAAEAAEMKFPLDRESLWETCWTTPFAHFFRQTPQGLLEIRGAPIQPGEDADRDSSPQGWFLVGRLWDESFLERLVSPENNYNLSLVPVAAAEETTATEPSPRVLLPLKNEHGIPEAFLEARPDPDDLRRWQAAGIDETVVVLAGAFGAILLITGWLEIWVRKPIQVIVKAMRTDSTKALDGMSRSPDEFGEIARMIIASSRQAAELRSETEQRRESASILQETEKKLRKTLQDRAEMALNLHDSSIQTLYASGMILVAVQNRIPDLPAEARATIQEVRKNLQTTIDELRSFIGESETTTLANTLSESINTMLLFLRNTSTVEIETEIDEIPNSLLSPEQGIHLMQVLREAVTNAIRHANAKVIKVLVRNRPGLVRLTVQDDGLGIPPYAPATSSRGLLNIHHRAELAKATLEINSTPEGGTRIDLVFKTT